MDTVFNIKRNVMESQCSSTSDTQQSYDYNDDAWQDLIGIAPDPPDRREKCEKCQ